MVLDQVSNEKLDQVHVHNITNKQEVITNAKGEFTIPATLGNLLVYSVIGYHTDTVLVTRLQGIKHYLSASINNLNAVKVNSVLDYKTQYKQNLTKPMQYY